MKKQRLFFVDFPEAVMMNQEERAKIISHLYAQANENHARLFSEMVSLLSDMEARISILEAKAALPMPAAPFSGVPACMPAPFMRINEMRAAHSFPPIQQGYEGKEQDLYLHLLKQGYNESEAADIAKEIEAVGHGRSESKK
jgi:hypothetical protein